MTAYTTILTYNSTNPASCSFSAPSPNTAWPLDLDEDDTLTISFSGFPTGSTMSSVTLTSNETPPTVITFPPSPSGEAFDITAVATTPPYDVTNSTFTVTITDNQDPTSAVSYQMVVSGTTGTGASWSGDPEVINNPG